MMITQTSNMSATIYDAWDAADNFSPDSLEHYMGMMHHDHRILLTSQRGFSAETAKNLEALNDGLRALSDVTNAVTGEYTQMARLTNKQTKI